MSEDDPERAVQILMDAGANKITVRMLGHRHWQVACEFGSAATDETDDTMDTPQQLAEHIVGARSPRWYKAEGGFPQPLPNTPQIETPVVAPPEPPATPDEAGAGASVPVVGDGDPEAATPAKTDAPAPAPVVDETAQEAPELGAEILEAEDMGVKASVPAPDATLQAELAPDSPDTPEQPFAGTVIQAGDPLDRVRSQRIGDVTRIALERDPPIDDAELTSLRNFAQGVAEGRWPDDPGKTAELQHLEAAVQLSGRIQAFAKQQTRALLAGDRDFVDNFNPDTGWPDA